MLAIANLHRLFAAPGLAPSKSARIREATELRGPDGVRDEPTDASYKAVIWPERAGALVVTRQGVPQISEIVYDLGGAFRPAKFIERDKLSSNDGQISSFLRHAREVLVMGAVVTDDILAFAADLDRVGCRSIGIPNCSVGQIRLWNSKTGGRDLLLSVPRAAHRLPPSHVAYGLDQAAALVASHGPEETLFLKAEFAIGGAGVLRVKGGERNLRERLRHWEQSLRHLGKPKLLTWEGGEAILIEQAVGCPDPSRNLSITADFEVAAETVRLIGFGRQDLYQDVAYQGLSWRPDLLSRSQQEELTEIGVDVGRRMSARGYSGLFNMDFIVHPDTGECWVIEINVRRSAPLDQFLLLERLVGPAWMDSGDVFFRFDEAGLARSGGVQGLAREGLLFDPTRGSGVLPVTRPDLETQRWPIMIIARSCQDLEDLQRRYRE